MSDGVIEFTLPFALQGLNVRDRSHWTKRRKDKARMMTLVMAAIGGPAHFPHPPWECVTVTITRCSSGQLDPDNLAASAKNLLDALGAAHGLAIIRDDNPDALTLVISQEKAPRGSSETHVRIERRD